MNQNDYTCITCNTVPDMRGECKCGVLHISNDHIPKPPNHEIQGKEPFPRFQTRTLEFLRNGIEEYKDSEDFQRFLEFINFNSIPKDNVFKYPKGNAVWTLASSKVNENPIYICRSSHKSLYSALQTLFIIAKEIDNLDVSKEAWEEAWEVENIELDKWFLWQNNQPIVYSITQTYLF